MKTVVHRGFELGIVNKTDLCERRKEKKNTQKIQRKAVVDLLWKQQKNELVKVFMCKGHWTYGIYEFTFAVISARSLKRNSWTWVNRQF